jgi:uracil-DNA glycosylase family 4
MEPYGKGKKRILIVGEAPGQKEDEEGRPFIGKSGRLLKKTLKRVKVNMDKDCTLYNALICRPPENATPTDDQIEWCNPNLQKLIKEESPNVIITVGKAALQSVLTGIWEEKLGAMGRWAGWQIPMQKYNAWIVPTYHPSYVMRQVEDVKGGTPIRRIFQNHLKMASKLHTKPYKKAPDWKKKIRIMYDDKSVAEELDFFVKKGGPVSFDFETNMLKPDSKESDIVAASVCWKGKTTIAFPFRGEKTKKAFRRLMKAKNPKIGHNIKYEDRWYPEIKNWIWCTMVNAHLIDNRPDICSLEFQALVELGMEPYSQHISPFFKAKTSYTKNRIKEVEMNDLLLYNGFDSLLCFKIAVKQRKRLGLPKL